MRILIDNNGINEEGLTVETYLEYPDEQIPAFNQDTLVLELNYTPINGISGFRLVEEVVAKNGDRLVSQEYILAPDVAVSLFKYFQQLNDD